MYNWRIKRDFFKNINTPERYEYMTKLFTKLRKYEEKERRDIGEFDLNEILSVLIELFGKSVYLYRSLASIIEYKIWYLDYANVSSQSLSEQYELICNINKIRSTMVSSPYFMDKFLDSIFKPIHENTLDNIYRCALWLVYIGVDQKDLYDIQTEDVDLLHRVININGREFKIWDEAFSSVENCVNSDSYYINTGGVKGENILKYRREGTQLLRNCRSNERTRERFLTTIQTNLRKKRHDNDVSKSLSLISIRRSGIYYSVRKAEIEQGVPANFKHYTKEAASIKRLEKEYYLWCLAGLF